MPIINQKEGVSTFSVSLILLKPAGWRIFFQIQLHSYCVESVQIWSLSDPYFPVLGLNTEIYGVVQSEYRKIRTRKNSVFGHFSRSVGRYGHENKGLRFFIIKVKQGWKLLRTQNIQHGELWKKKRLWYLYRGTEYLKIVQWYVNLSLHHFTSLPFTSLSYQDIHHINNLNQPHHSNCSPWKESVFGVFLVHIFPSSFQQPYFVNCIWLSYNEENRLYIFFLPEGKPNFVYRNQIFLHPNRCIHENYF